MPDPTKRDLLPMGEFGPKCPTCSGEYLNCPDCRGTGRVVSKSDGGPSGYYDLKPSWVTLNDLMEWLAINRWGAYALHLKDAMKACYRLGSKDGTEAAYDAKKIVYSGLRLLTMISGRRAVREYLETLLADPQFRGDDDAGR